MVVQHQVIVDGFRNVDAADLIVFAMSLLRDDPDRIGGIIATDIEEVSNLVCF